MSNFIKVLALITLNIKKSSKNTFKNMQINYQQNIVFKNHVIILKSENFLEKAIDITSFLTNIIVKISTSKNL